MTFSLSVSYEPLSFSADEAGQFSRFVDMTQLSGVALCQWRRRELKSGV